MRQIALFHADVQAAIEPRITRQRFDQARRMASITDPRHAESHTSTVYSLTGLRLLMQSADAGWRIDLPGEAGQPLISWDERGSRFSRRYDGSLRPTQLAEQLPGQAQTVSERFTYGDATQEAADHNQCGRLVRRDDGSGSLDIADYGVSDTVLRQQRRFLAALDIPDWPEEPVQRDRLLGGEAYLTTTAFNALAETIGQRDAQGNRQARGHTSAGQLERVTLQSGERKQVQTLVSDIRYNASAAVESETCGNGVVSRFFYDPQDGRLTRMLALSPDGHGLQDLNYTYDPVGNVVSLEDVTLPVSFFSNQRVEPVNRYVYDSLYQLIEATGREVASAFHLPGMPDLQPLPLDPGKLSHYTQRFEYDAGGNLLARHHSGADTRRMAVSSTSNRSLPQRADGSLPDDDQIAEAFDGNGNLKALQPGQAMTWDARNQLSEVTSVKRDQEPDDCELYRYDGEGQRVRKVRVNQARSRTLTAEVRYLPGLDIHRNEVTGEVRHVLTVQAGRSSVRLLHWESGKPDGIENDQLRYSLSDHLGSSTLELDQNAKLISHEGYYPFGGTAWWAGRSTVEAKYKTVRYSGKERDATGLYYYGYRYYAPWLQRWVNPDPAGDVQGVNRYRFVGNSPVSKKEVDGQVYEGINDAIERRMVAMGDQILWRGLSQFEPSSAARVRRALCEVNQMYTDAVRMVEAHPAEAAPILQSYFGSAHPTVMEGVKSAWVKTRELAAEYSQGWGQDKFVGVIGGDAGQIAKSYRDDFHGRIIINRDDINNPEFNMTLAHELSHLKRVNRIKTVGPSTMDYFYLWESGLKTMTGRTESRHEVAMESVSEVLMNGRASIGFLYKQQAIFYQNFMPMVRSRDPSTRGGNMGIVISAFNARPDIRAQMAADNADSLAWSAYSLQRRYQQLRRPSVHSAVTIH
ncbi:RHS repeat domain-containing protein [Pseudomonas sp. UBA1879]|uniref:RHS repeat domain-containing protein n=1 Tax=Pseudomonas sp. UBA1879 TaxID=1947305 RepID=UPI0025F00711|nr:RHS repeat-associated core domain-containing protein [Pseudomonas sp. UBA1879]